MMIFYGELYGFHSNDLEATAKRLEEVLGIEFTPREASNLGDYSSGRSWVRVANSPKRQLVKLTLCWNDTQREEGWITPAFKEYPLVLMADHPGPPERLREPLSKMTEPEPVLITQFWYDENVEEEGTLFLLEPSKEK